MGKKGIVRDAAIHEEVLSRTTDEALKLGFMTRGLIKSSVRGHKGNREFFVHWSLTGEPLIPDEVHRLIKEAVGNEKD